MQEFRPEPEDIGKRVDVFVAEKYPQFTRASLRGLFESDKVLINGERKKAGHKLKPEDKVKVDANILFIEPDEIELPVIHEDDDVVVIDKPAGVLTHSKGAINQEATVASFLKGKLNDSELLGNRAGIVHRLDRATSGVIIGAKNASATTKLQKQFSNRKTKKIYFAIVEGIPEPEEAIIDTPIQRNPSRPQTFKVGAHGKPAQTAFKVLRSFSIGDKAYSLLELKPITGRTHQLRVHLSYIGHPVVGDPVYGHGGDSLMLHAASLELTLPSSERRIFTSPLPAKFKDFENNG